MGNPLLQTQPAGEARWKTLGPGRPRQVCLEGGRDEGPGEGGGLFSKGERDVGRGRSLAGLGGPQRVCRAEEGRPNPHLSPLPVLGLPLLTSHFFFLGLHLPHMDVPRLQVESELPDPLTH